MKNLVYFASFAVSSIRKGLEPQLYRELNLSWVANALTEKSVKVEETRCGERVLIARTGQRVDSVIRIKRIEHLDLRNQLDSFGDIENTRELPIKREKFVVLAQSVTVCCRPCGRRGGLCCSGLNARAKLKLAGKFDKGKKVELVPDVSIGQGIIKARIIDVK